MPEPCLLHASSARMLWLEQEQAVEVAAGVRKVESTDALCGHVVLYA